MRSLRISQFFVYNTRLFDAYKSALLFLDEYIFFCFVINCWKLRRSSHNFIFYFIKKKMCLIEDCLERWLKCDFIYTENYFQKVLPFSKKKNIMMKEIVLNFIEFTRRIISDNNGKNVYWRMSMITWIFIQCMIINLCRSIVSVFINYFMIIILRLTRLWKWCF